MGSVLAQKPFQGVQKAPSQLSSPGDYVVFPAWLLGGKCSMLNSYRMWFFCLHDVYVTCQQLIKMSIEKKKNLSKVRRLGGAGQRTRIRSWGMLLPLGFMFYDLCIHLISNAAIAPEMLVQQTHWGVIYHLMALGAKLNNLAMIPSRLFTL